MTDTAAPLTVDPLPTVDTLPTAETPADDEAAPTPVVIVEEILVEDVSIDGMCGVY